MNAPDVAPSPQREMLARTRPGYAQVMNDPVPVSTRTIWLAAAGLFGLAFLVGLFKGSTILAILLLLIAGGCVYQSRRAPRNDGANASDDQPSDTEEGESRDADDEDDEDDEDDADDAHVRDEEDKA